jgi:prolycopene isomerase
MGSPLRASPPPGTAMKFHGEARRERYDAVVVGAGLGGLSAAALLARAGRRVLVVERHDRLGGYAHAFRRGRCVFDSAVHLVGGCEPVAWEGGGLVHRLLEALGVRDLCRFERIDPCYRAVYPGLTVSAPCDLEEFVSAHAKEFPAEEKGLRQVMQECLAIRQEACRAGELGSAFEVMRGRQRFPTLLRYRRATLAQVLDEHLAAPELKALLGTLWPYLGLPPSRVSFLYFATMLVSYVADGAYYCRGSFQRLANALGSAVERWGGELLLRSPVRRIAVEGGRARGIVLENGQRIAAPLVVSNADATQTVEELVGRDAFPADYLEALGRLRPSISAFVVYAAAELALDPESAAHESFLFPGFDHDATFAGSRRGEGGWLSVTIPTLADPELAPAGRHLFILTTLVSADAAASWREAKQGTVQRMLERASRLVPGLAERAHFVEGATPRTLERYTRNAGGACYGWELSPRQVGPGRLASQTPVAGLALVGHWTQPGAGVTGVLTSGVQTARALLGHRTEAELWRALSG